MGAGDDSFTWDPGDGSDKVEGEAGSDTMVFNGAGAAENFDFSANGNRLRFFRTQGTITMDTAGVERVDLRALGGIDNTVVNDLSATDVKNIVLDLANGRGGRHDHDQRHRRQRHDHDRAQRGCGRRDRTGRGREDRALGGRERPPERQRARRQRHDLRRGRARSPDQGRDRRRRRERHDQRRRRSRDACSAATATTRSTETVAPTRGCMGAGDDTFVWDPGDGSDVVEGQDGADTMLFNGAGVRRELRRLGQRQPPQVLPHPGRHHDGPERHRVHRRPSARRGRQRGRERHQRDRPQARRVRPRGRDRRRSRRRRGRLGHGQRHERPG